MGGAFFWTYRGICNQLLCIPWLVSYDPSMAYLTLPRSSLDFKYQSKAIEHTYEPLETNSKPHQASKIY